MVYFLAKNGIFSVAIIGILYITIHNYFYPYELFAYYAHQIFQMLKEKADLNDVYLDPEYRYVFVDSFLGYVAQKHDEEISVLKQRIRDGGFGYA